MKNKFQNTIKSIAVGVICFFGGIAFVNSWLVLKKNYPKIGLFDIPFDSNVWGTVSDWVLVIGTLFSLYFIWKTLNSQLRIQELQQTTTEIEKFNHIKNIKPEFELRTVSKKLTVNSNGTPTVSYGMNCLATKNSAKNITGSIILNNFIDDSPSEIPISIKKIDEGLGFVEFFDVERIKIGDQPEKYIVQFAYDLIFEDIEGNRYSKIFYFSDNNEDKPNVEKSPTTRVEQ